jgi:DNA-binding transcriptional ArsR family regulator
VSINTKPVDIVFGALSGQVRRDLLGDIVRHKAATATNLAADRSMSRQGVSRHLDVLSSAGLVERERVGRCVFYRANGAALFSALAWISELGADVAAYQGA